MASHGHKGQSWLRIPIAIPTWSSSPSSSLKPRDRRGRKLQGRGGGEERKQSGDVRARRRRDQALRQEHHSAVRRNQLHTYMGTQTSSLSLKNRDDLCTSFQSQAFREEETAPESPDSQETNEHESTMNSMPEERRSDAGSWQEKAARKPEKMLPCPRCGSPDTKFCYYNNYNVNQPRHFCRNCHRYWTAGGAMRNVPVGAGRLKNRSSSHDRHVALRFGYDAAGNDGDEQSRKQWEGTSSFPVAFYPAVAQWSWTVLPGIWTTPWLSPVASSSPGSSSPTTRKRSRTDDPEEAVRSSVFKAFLPKEEVKDHGMEASLLPLHANPTALSRSLNFNFQESS
ncbi:hypothetical protein OPV22_015286 [Ensete ventricosum]|uniref:Dof-type domain-containing protein n=1 Tax=Ensete ventricosum TaxID=4639 RepID=A0AAV8R9I5_ENSVE|nr:hypothetical protein OPV22_015286 [Ensete ventricosum]